jgi:hypothetical protein
MNHASVIKLFAFLYVNNEKFKFEKREIQNAVQYIEIQSMKTREDTKEKNKFKENIYSTRFVVSQ